MNTNSMHRGRSIKFTDLVDTKAKNRYLEDDQGNNDPALFDPEYRGVRKFNPSHLLLLPGQIIEAG